MSQLLDTVLPWYGWPDVPREANGFSKNFNSDEREVKNIQKQAYLSDTVTSVSFGQ